MNTCLPDAIAEDFEAPTPQAIKTARERQLEYICKIRQKLMMSSLVVPARPRPVGDLPMAS